MGILLFLFSIWLIWYVITTPTRRRLKEIQKELDELEKK